MRSGTRRRPLRFIGATVTLAVVASTAAVTLPVVEPEPKPAHLAREEIALSGAGADARPAAVAENAPEPEAEAPPRTVEEGWSAEVDVPDDTQLVDFTWDGDAHAHLQLRFREDDGGWSPWTNLESHEDEGPDSGGNGRKGIPPVWLGSNGTEDVQVKVTEGELTDLEVAASHWTPPTGGATAGAEPAGPRLHGRNEWAPGGWRSDIPGCGSGPTVMPQLKHAVVHHTVNANTYSASNVPGMLAAIYRFHTDGRGWCDIAYHVLIDRFGRAWQGRSGDLKSNVMGGHAKGFNTDSVGIAFLGQHDPGSSPPAARPTAAAIDTLESTLAWKLSINGLHPQGRSTVTSQGSTRYPAGRQLSVPVINGHSDTSLTGCPGDYVYNLLPTIRANVARRIASAARPGTWAPFSTGQSFFRRLSVDTILTSTVTDAAIRTSLVARSGRSRASVSNDLVISTSTHNRMGFLVPIYYGFTGQAPTSSAYLRTWVARRDQGWYHERVAQSFADKYAAGMSDEAFVRLAYRNVIGTTSPPASNLATWVGRLRSGWTRGQVMLFFLDNPSFRFRVNRERVLTMIYFSLLRRLPDASGRALWTAFWNNGATTTDTVHGVLGSVEYRNRF